MIDQPTTARHLRSLGLSHSEIARELGVPRSTVATWCRTIVLSPDQVQAIKDRTSQKGRPRDTQRRRREEIGRIRELARAQVPELIRDPLWVAGVVLYWGEGAKTSNCLKLANADPVALRLFRVWTETHHEGIPGFRTVVNLHAGNDVEAAHEHWAVAIGIPRDDFLKPFIKPDGTGHRRNHLATGVCSLRARCSTDAFHRTMAWIGALPDWLPPGVALA